MVVQERLKELRIFAWVVFQVGVLNEDETAACFGESRSQGRTFSPIAGVENDANPFVEGDSAGEEIACSIGAAVVYDDDFHRFHGGSEHLFQTRVNRVALVVARDDDTEDGDVGHRKTSTSRLWFLMLAARVVDTGDEEELALISEMVSEHLAWEMRLGGATLPAFEGRLEGDVSRTVSPEIVATPVPIHPPEPPREEEAFTASAEGLSKQERVHRLAVIAEEAARCTRCGLHETRTKSVFARGNPESPLVFVGEGPGYHEDQEGLPFVGAAGQLLDRMIAAMGFGRDEVYICNVVKCRPPDNRTPKAEEAKACETFLVPQLEIVAPKVIVALGRTAAENLGCLEPGRAWRGTWRAWRGIPVMPTYHPAFLLRSPEMKKPVWEDLQHVLTRLGRTPPLAKKSNEG